MFDFRKHSQYFRLASGKNIYCWRKPNNTYDIGVNGTNWHVLASNKDEAKAIILQALREQRF